MQPCLLQAESRSGELLFCGAGQVAVENGGFGAEFGGLF